MKCWILSCKNRVPKAVFTKEIGSKKCFESWMKYSILSCQNRVRKANFIMSKSCLTRAISTVSKHATSSARRQAIFNSFFWIRESDFENALIQGHFMKFAKNCNFDQSFKHAEIMKMLETHKINSFCLFNFRERVCTKHAKTLTRYVFTNIF